MWKSWKSSVIFKTKKLLCFIFYRPMIQSTLHGRLHPHRQAGSWNIPCTWQWRKVAPPTRSVQVRWLLSGSTVAPRRPVQSVPPTWTMPTLTAPPPTGQLLSSASQPRMSRAMARRRRSAGFKVEELELFYRLLIFHFSFCEQTWL